ncbi:hypothetical protein TNCT_517451 [Trichonephila clavata]|uniref:Uncharacterized protein n=1 Tax=Trichonephila clavata TaxID=2740835 RepID=A0A8X6HQH2_TRICU|nr:hypothetical protein TNCT_517451 [Trichonephila clavata]
MSSLPERCGESHFKGKAERLDRDISKQEHVRRAILSFRHDCLYVITPNGKPKACMTAVMSPPDVIKNLCMAPNDTFPSLSLRPSSKFSSAVFVFEKIICAAKCGCTRNSDFFFQWEKFIFVPKALQWTTAFLRWTSLGPKINFFTT